MKLQQRIALLSLAGILVSGFVYSQIYIHKKNREELKDIAQELAYTWKHKLDLSEEQTMLLEDIIIEYTIKKNEVINSPLPENAQIKQLQAIQQSEHRYLKKFLNQDQFANYVALNKEITRKL